MSFWGKKNLKTWVFVLIVNAFFVIVAGTAAVAVDDDSGADGNYDDNNDDDVVIVGIGIVAIRFSQFHLIVEKASSRKKHSFLFHLHSSFFFFFFCLLFAELFADESASCLQSKRMRQ